ncbi:hypothetical protein Syun_016344 [Stephania yunnanensis]|uniref:Zinc knuckle CX2CX4HX4C domain-containing protein n=1 Tax=Stephania yunnanensis TaxID=152371 RepID=A0AAP0J795_9MAGN
MFLILALGYSMITFFFCEKWSPNASLDSNDINTCKLWVQLHNLPIDCRSENIAQLIAKELGSPNKVEKDWRQNGLLLEKFLKVKVEVDVNKPLMRRKKIISGFKPISIEFKYERIKVICHIYYKITHFKHLCDQDHPTGQSYPYGDWMLVEYLLKQPATQRGEPSRRRTASRGTSSENMEHKMKDQNIYDFNMSLLYKNKSLVHLVDRSNHLQSIGNFSGSSSNQVSKDAGAKSALRWRYT